eukprot:9491795-Pyramimonas_sp.AAC.1
MQAEIQALQHELEQAKKDAKSTALQHEVRLKGYQDRLEEQVKLVLDDAHKRGTLVQEKLQAEEQVREPSLP